MGPMYEAWASRQFGPTVAARVGELFSGIDWDSIPQPVGWDGDGYESPGVILANAACGEGSTTWPQLNASYSFVDTFESLESEVVGTGNRARFSYWLKTMQGLRLIGEFGCVRGVFEAAMNSGSFATALEQRTALARLFERIITLLNVCDPRLIEDFRVINDMVQEGLDSLKRSFLLVHGPRRGRNVARIPV